MCADLPAVAIAIAITRVWMGGGGTRLWLNYKKYWYDSYIDYAYANTHRRRAQSC